MLTVAVARRRLVGFAVDGLRAVMRHIALLRSDRRGTVAVITAFGLSVLLGAIGLGIEVSDWYLSKRAMQNAADSAAIAAATNGGATYEAEAKAVAAEYGFTDGVNNTTVVVSNSATCPGGGTTCFSVAISRLSPLIFSKVVGYSGNKTVSGTDYMSIAAASVAEPAPVPRQYCILALAGSGEKDGIRTNGAPKANLAGCSIMSNTSATCKGHNLLADYGDAHGTNDNCGIKKRSDVPVVSDPYSGLASHIPADTCGGSYPQKPAKKKDPALPAANQWSGSKTLSGNVLICGDLQLTGNTTINAPTGAVLVIENGRLDANGYTLRTASGSALTVVFSGTNSASYDHIPTGGGTLDITAPTSGPWKGVAIYQDPSLTTNVDISDAGNSPTWDITGLVYLPHSTVTFSGAVNKSSNGHSCFGLVVDNITINGTGSILAHGECAAAGLNLPEGNAPGRGQLVN